jgi:dynein heavy chain
MGNVHLMVGQVCELYFLKMRRRVWVTPKSYLSYLNLYLKYYDIKYKELDEQAVSFKKGLDKIQEAAVSIALMETQLKSEEGVLKEAAETTDAMLKELDKERAKVSKKQNEVAHKTAMCQKQAETIQSEKSIAEEELKAALPALEAADEAVRQLEKKDIDDLKANRNPMVLIKYIMDCVGIFFKSKLAPVQGVSVMLSQKDPAPTNFTKDSWDETKVLLQDTNFKNSLEFYERDGISEETMEMLSVYTSETSPLCNHFNFEQASKISKAAAGILKWVLAIQEYHLKSKIVKPRKIALAISEGKL